jgi:hypothetical protein
MGNKMRWKYGDTNPVVAPVDSAVAVEIGDLLYWDTDDAKPATSQADQGSEAANQILFAANFLGVAMQAKAAGAAGTIRVATAGVFEFDSPSATHELAAFFGASENAGGDALLDQQIEIVTTADKAIGRVARRDSAATTTGMVQIGSPVMLYPYYALANMADVGTMVYTAGYLMVADGTDWEAVALSGAFTMAATGALRMAQATVAAAGSVQGDATAITAEGLCLVTAADATKGVKLPAAAAGKMVLIKNNANAVLKVWPNTDDAINAIAANSALSMAAYTCALFVSYDAVTWYTCPLLPS